MKMSPWRSQGVLQTGFAVKQGDASVKGLIDLNFGSGKAEALSLLRDLEALALPLHDVIVTDHALMNQAADAPCAIRNRWNRCICAWACLRIPCRTRSVSPVTC